jgi:hypothetical protein
VSNNSLQHPTCRFTVFRSYGLATCHFVTVDAKALLSGTCSLLDGLTDNMGWDVFIPTLNEVISLQLSEVTDILEKAGTVVPFYARILHSSWQNK